MQLKAENLFVNSKNRAFIVTSGAVAILVILFAFSLRDYVTKDTYLILRISQQLQNGHGLVTNPDSTTLNILTPLAPLLLSLIPLTPEMANTVLHGALLLVGGCVLYSIMLGEYQPDVARLLTLASIVLWPTWSHGNAQETLAFLLLLTSLWSIRNGRIQFGGGVAGLAAITSVTAWLPVLLLGVYSLVKSENWRFWWWMIVVPLTWVMIAALIFDTAEIQPMERSIELLDILTLGLFLAGAMVLQWRGQIPGLVTVFVMWGSVYLLGEFLLTGNLPPGRNPILSVTIVLSFTTLASRYSNNAPSWSFISMLVFGGAITMTTLSTDQSLMDDRELGVGLQRSMSDSTVILHDRSHAFTVALDRPNATIQLLHSNLEPNFAGLMRRGDLASAIIWLAPDDIIVDDEIFIMISENSALQYDVVDNDLGVNMLHRSNSVGDYFVASEIQIPFGPEVTAVSVSTDRAVLQPAEVIRFGIDWELFQTPTDNVPLRFIFNFVDRNGVVVSSVVTDMPAQLWQETEFTSYHAIGLPLEIEPGVYTLNLAIDYRAGELGRQDLISLPLPFDKSKVNTLVQVGSLGQVVLHEAFVDVNDTSLQAEMVWGVEETSQVDYQVFFHITPIDDLQPVIQADGPPVAGRYPTAFWRPGDVIRDNRQADIISLPPGQYRINVGFFDAHGARLNGPDGDYITTHFLTVTEDGVTVSIDE